MEKEQKGQCGTVQCKSMCQQIGIILDGNVAVRYAILIVSAIQVIGGVVAIGAWTEMLVAGLRVHPITSYAGIWTGAYALIPGLLGLLCSMKSCNAIVRMRMFYAHFGTSMGLFGVEAQLIRYSVEAMTCGLLDYKPTLGCFLGITPKFHNLVIVSLAMGVVLVLTAFCVIGYYVQVVCVEVKKARRAAQVDKTQMA